MQVFTAGNTEEKRTAEQLFCIAHRFNHALVIALRIRFALFVLQSAEERIRGSLHRMAALKQLLKNITSVSILCEEHLKE